METIDDYDFYLPEELIATAALNERPSSKLLRLGKDDKAPVHDSFANIGTYLHAGDVLVVNNTKVMKARLYAYKPSGGRVEILLVRPLGEKRWHALLNARGANLVGTHLRLGSLENSALVRVENKVHDEPGLYELYCEIDLAAYAHEHGAMPLPPYFGRDANAHDEIRYQTVFARDHHWGAVAAPTAGLHFNEALLAKLATKGVIVVEITLHVGPGTFLPIRVHNINEHRMHAEFFSLSESAARILNQAKEDSKRIIAVGSTAMRVLEQVMLWAQERGEKRFFACESSSALFIKPGFNFLACDGLITNFHLPRSTLIVLVAAVIGRERALACYEEAIKHNYRFYSYGDACFFDIL